MRVRTAVAGGALCLWGLSVLFAQAEAPPSAAYLSHDRARPVFEALEERLPSAEAWPQWIAEADRDTRARVAEGDDTSLVNLLLFGTSFTNEPRITARQLDERQINATLTARLTDFERALTRPGADERLLFARQTLGDGAAVGVRLRAMLDRAIREGETHARLIQSAQALGDPSLEFAERSRLYRTRGLSSDSSLRTNFAIEEALSQIHAGGASPRLRRVGIIGPGLDFTDKQEGYDFYPPQTIQPFAVMDSLLRLGLADRGALSVTTLDLSARVTDHVDRAVRRARQGAPYVIQLPLPADVSWTPELLGYWQRFGDAIAGGAEAVRAPRAVGPLKMRAVGVRAPWVERITARDVNITAQHLVLTQADRFDLLIGTNVFVYYDRLQQGLAMINVAHMLRPGGFLLSNNALLELPSSGLRSTGYSRTRYSDREEDGDLIIWYQLSASITPQ